MMPDDLQAVNNTPQPVAPDQAPRPAAPISFGQSVAAASGPVAAPTAPGAIGAVALSQPETASAAVPAPQFDAQPRPDIAQPAAPPVTPMEPAAQSQSEMSVAATPSPLVSPAEMSPVVTSDAPAQPTAKSSNAGHKRRALWKQLPKPAAIGLIVVATLLIVGSGLVFGLYLPNTPNGIYSAGLDNTGQMLDGLVSYMKSIEKAGYHSTDFDGRLQVQSSAGSFDISMTGAADEKANLTAQLTTDIMGVKGGASLRTIHISDDSSPDVYVRLSGIKGLLDKVGASSLEGLDSRWLLVDHTLLNTYASSLTAGQVSKKTTAPSYEQLQDAAAKTQVVNRQYLFTTDDSKAVLANQKYLSQVTDGGRTLDHYRVGYNRAHFEAYAKALAAALDQSALNDWAKSAAGGKQISDLMQFAQLEKDISTAKADYTFELWVDTGTRLVSKVSLTDPDDAKSVFTISQSHVSGDSYPVTMALSTVDDSGNPQTVSITASVNTKTNTTSLSAKVSAQDAGDALTVDLSLTTTPSAKAVNVTVPAGAKSITELLLGLGGETGPDAPSPLIFQQ